MGYFHRKGINFSIYIDDGIVMAPSPQQLAVDLQFVYDTLRKAGWQLSEDKSDSPDKASQVKRNLGFLLDSRLGRVLCPEDRLLKIISHIEKAIKKERIPIKEVASVNGQIIS